MQKKLTISIDESIYTRLHQLIGRGNISKFIEEKIKPFLNDFTLAQAYKESSSDLVRNKESKKWNSTSNDGLESMEEENIDDWV